MERRFKPLFGGQNAPDSSCTEEDAFVIGEKLRAAIANEPFPLDQDSLRVTCSFGVCWSAHPNPSMQAELLSMADAALYRAKRSGRNCVKSSDRALDSTCINQRT